MTPMGIRMTTTTMDTVTDTPTTMITVDTTMTTIMPRMPTAIIMATGKEQTSGSSWSDP